MVLMVILSENREAVLSIVLHGSLGSGPSQTILTIDGGTSLHQNLDDVRTIGEHSQVKGCLPKFSILNVEVGRMTCKMYY